MSLQTANTQTATAAGNGTTESLANNVLGTDLYVQINVTAASGTTPALGATIQQSVDGTTWTTTDTLPAITGVSVTTFRATVKGTFARVAWAPTGTTPSFTFTANIWA